MSFVDSMSHTRTDIERECVWTRAEVNEPKFECRAKELRVHFISVFSTLGCALASWFQFFSLIAAKLCQNGNKK